MKTLNRGILIAVEGIDGSGKSTLIINLAQALRAAQIPVLATKEPGGTELGKQLRTLLQERTFTIYPKAEYLLFAADRAQHFEELVVPALKKNTLVISDRMADSSVVYQGYGRGLDIGMLQTVSSWAMNGIEPDLVLYVKIPPAVAYQRLATRKNLSTFDREKEEFFAKISEGFEALFSMRSNVVHLDGLQDPNAVTEKATQAIITWITQHNLLS